MTNKTNSPVCERSSDLMAFLYSEMNVSESREFEAHLQKCVNCREEAASFGVVRESIVAWREEVLTGFVPTTASPTKRSAVAAFRQFFDLSPLWLKGAAAFAVLTFCVLVVLVFITSERESRIPDTVAVYTQQDVDRLIREAVAQHRKNTSPEKVPETIAALDPPASKAKPVP